MQTISESIKQIILESGDKIVIDKLKNIKGIELFGSRFQGNFNSTSDVDIIIEFKNNDVNDIANSVFNPKNRQLVKSKTKEIKHALGLNPETNKPYKLQIVGRYELRNF
jgi:predicted nucleotidyltransferase